MFKVTQFDSDNVADNACEQLFEKPPKKNNKKNKVLEGKITKKLQKKNDLRINEDKIKSEIQSILNNNLKLAHKKKTKKSKNKKHTFLNEEPNDSVPGKYVSLLKQKHDIKNETEKQNKTGKKRKKKKSELGHDLQDEARNSAPQNGHNNLTEKQQKKRKKKNEGSLVQTNIANYEVAQQNIVDLNQKKKRKKRKKKNRESTVPNHTKEDSKPVDYEEKRAIKMREKLQRTLNAPLITPKKQKRSVLTLRERMMQKLQAARFRFINEQIYSTDSKQAQKIFNEDPDAFQAYHEGYRRQVDKWPLNPVDVIIKSIQKMPKTLVIADFGCGDAKIAKSLGQKVHSFDLVATNELVTACDMAHVPLQNNSVDVVVFCLSLMGTNLLDYLLEANRVLVQGGVLKIAEVESRFDDVNEFIEGLKRFNFKNTWKDLSHNLFYFLDFKKEADIKNKKKLPTISLHPCLYKKR